MGSFTPFWIAVIIIALAVGVINFAIGATRRGDMVALAVRMAAGLASILAAGFIIYGKLADIMPTRLSWPEKIVMAGLFVFAVLFIPSVIERNRAQETTEPTLQQRAARPVNATIRLREASDSEWIN